MVPSQAKSLHLKLIIVKWGTSKIGHRLFKQLRFYENVFELLKLGSGLVQLDPLLGRQHRTCAPNLVNILLQQVAHLERDVQQLVDDEGGTTHGELEPEHLFQKLFLARYRLRGLLRLKLQHKQSTKKERNKVRIAQVMILLTRVNNFQHYLRLR